MGQRAKTGRKNSDTVNIEPWIIPVDTSCNDDDLKNYSSLKRQHN